MNTLNNRSINHSSRKPQQFLAFIFVALVFFSCQNNQQKKTKENSSQIQESGTAKTTDSLKFAVDIVEKYYRSKDLGEVSDFSSEVSDEVLKLLNAKIEMSQFQNTTSGIAYSDYQISVSPSKQEKWHKKGDAFFMILQVVRTWFYDINKIISKEKTTSSELLGITLLKEPTGGYKMTGCYAEYEDLTLGPIDALYRKALLDKKNPDSLLKQYTADFKKQCIEKKKSSKK